MKRKIIQLAGKTLVISLPSKWAKQYGVKKGDEMDVEEHEKGLILGPQSHASPEEKEINADLLGVLTKRYLFRQYQEGIDKIQINFENPEEIGKIQGYITELIGYEIVKQGTTHAIINDVSGQAYQEFDQLMRRLFLLLKGIIEDSYTALKEKKFDVLNSIVCRDADINKFTHFCLRSLSKQKIKESKKAAYFCILYTLERIGDDYKRLIKHLYSQKIIPDKEIVDLYSNVKDFFSKTYEFTFDNKLETAKEIAKIHTDARRESNKLINTQKGDAQASFYLRSIINSLITIQELQLPYMKI